MIEVLKQALDALEFFNETAICFADTDISNEAITSLRQAIAELESQEPVALPCCGYRDASAVKWNPLNDVVQCHNCGQTYAHPPQCTEQNSVQVSPLEFVEMVMEKEHLIGKPIFWAEWPNKEKNNA